MRKPSVRSTVGLALVFLFAASIVWPDTLIGQTFAALWLSFMACFVIHGINRAFGFTRTRSS